MKKQTAVEWLTDQLGIDGGTMRDKALAMEKEQSPPYVSLYHLSKLNEIIEKYEAKLDYLNKAVEQTKHLMDEDTLDMMNDMKILLTEVVTDFKTIQALNGGDK